MTLEEIKAAIEQIEMFSECEEYYRQNYRVVQPPELLFPALNTALSALREVEERRENKPLTLYGLTQRAGKPVWVESQQEGNVWAFCSTVYGHVIITDVYGGDYGFEESDYGKTWLAYEHERSDT